MAIVLFRAALTSEKGCGSKVIGGLISPLFATSATRKVADGTPVNAA
jgi:hypothetical protein